MKQKHARKGTATLLMLGCLFMLLFSGSGLYAQSRPITGIVTDANGPMVGVAVTVQGTSTGVLTNGQGRYSINASTGQTLVFSFMGYADQEVRVGTQSAIDVVMDESVTGLDEVVVIGYGTVRKRDLTGAVSSVKSDDLVMSPVSNPIEALQGRIAGLDISRNDGRSTSGSSILLRGNRTLDDPNLDEDKKRNTNPLYIIDGLPGNIENLNPNDIQTIDVLKDASSTAIYGSEGANGVIIITTKHAEKGRIQIDFNAYVGINSNGRYPSALSGDAWNNYLREGYLASYPDMAGDDWSAIFTAWNLDPAVMDTYMKNNQWIDWVDETLRTGVSQNYSLSVRGGTERTQAHFSLGYNSTQGIFRNDQSDMYTMRTGITQHLKPWFRAGIQIGMSWKDSESRPSRLNKLFDMAPLGEVYDANGEINPFPIAGMSNVSPIADDVPGAYKNNSKALNLNVNPYVEFDIIQGLTLRSQLGTTLSHTRRGEFSSKHTYMELAGSGNGYSVAKIKNQMGYSYVWENIANYNVTIANDHNLAATLVSSWTYNQREESNAQANDLSYDEFLWHNLKAGSMASAVTSSYGMNKKMSFAARVNYSYKGKYLFTFSNRTDGVSVLSKKWDSFPAGAVAWRLSDENFMEGTRNWLDNLKLRAGYGVSGSSSINEYETRTEAATAGDLLNLGGGKIISTVPTKAVGNLNLGWEKTYNLNIGLDFSLFKNRLDASIEWYDSKTKGLLLSQKLPTSGGGFDSKNPYTMTGNIAQMVNRGIEVTLSARPIVNKNFRWESTVTFARNKEKINEIQWAAGNDAVNDLISLGLFVGHPRNTFFGLKKLGIWQLGEEQDAEVFGLAPGDVKTQSNLFKIEDGLWGTYDDEGKLVEYSADNKYTIDSKDRVIYGQGSPKWTGGWQNSFYWKNFDLNIFATARWGYMINADLLGMFRYGKTTLPDNYDYWTPTNATNDFPRPYAVRSNTQYSSPTVGLSAVDASYVKIKNITLGYTLPRTLLDKVGISNLRVYATMYNPIIITNDKMLKGTDPETGAGDEFPMYRQMVFGINLSF